MRSDTKSTAEKSGIQANSINKESGSRSTNELASPVGRNTKEKLVFLNSFLRN